MIVLDVEKNRLSIQQKEVLTSGSVNSCHVRFVFSEDWEGLTRTAVFKGSGETRSVLLNESGECAIPWETLEKPAGLLEVGVCGTRGTDTVLTTVLTNLGMILPGASPGENTQPPTPDVYQQILAETQEVRETTLQYKQAAEVSAGSAERSAKRAEAAAVNPPRLSEEDTWMVWDSRLGAYVDTGLSAVGPQGEQGGIGPQGFQGERGEQGPRGFPGTEVVIHETYGPSPVVTVDMSVPGTPLQPVSEIKLVQEGEGTPSLDNIRNIAGWDTITLKHNDDTHEAAFQETVYGGSYDWAKGELTVTHKCFSLAVADMNNSEDYPGWRDIPDLPECAPPGQTLLPGAISNLYPDGGSRQFRTTTSRTTLYVSSSNYNMTQSEWKKSYPDLIVQIVIPLLEPKTIQLAAQEITALAGGNTLSSGSGSTEVTFQADLKQYVDKKIAAAVTEHLTGR